MPYKRIPPVSVKEMMETRYNGYFTVCQKLREVYDLANSLEMFDDPEIKAISDSLQFKSREAMAMAKRMNDWLQKFKAYRESDEYQKE